MLVLLVQDGEVRFHLFVTVALVLCAAREIRDEISFFVCAELGISRASGICVDQVLWDKRELCEYGSVPSVVS